MGNELPKGARRAIRRVVDFDCELVSQHHDESLCYPVADLSPFGLWISTSDPMRTGEQVVVCFEPPPAWTEGEIMVFAEVARVSTARHRVDPTVGMGLEFLDLTRPQHRALSRWLDGRRTPVPRRRRPVPRRGWRVPAPPFRSQAEPHCYRPLASAWR